MIVPQKKAYQQIQGDIVDYLDVHMSVCGGGCSCPCKHTTSVSTKHIYAGMCGCNCTCGCNCNAPITRDILKDVI